MEKSEWRKWIVLVILVVFALQLSEVYAQGMVSRKDILRIILLAALASVLGFVGFSGWKRIKEFVWNPLSTRQRSAIVWAGIGLFLGGTFIYNHGKPDADFNDVLACVSVMFFGLYLLFSRVLDALWARFQSRRK